MLDHEKDAATGNENCSENDDLREPCFSWSSRQHHAGDERDGDRRTETCVKVGDKTQHAQHEDRPLAKTVCGGNGERDRERGVVVPGIQFGEDDRLVEAEIIDARCS